jgi:hypothetical protein
MSLRPSWGAVCALLSFVFGTTAWGDAVSDLTAGQTLYLNALTVQLEDKTFPTAGHVLPKNPGTLSLTLNGMDLGLGIDEDIYLSGSSNGDLVKWTFNKHFNPPLDVDGTNSVHHAYGQVVVKVKLLSGQYAPECGAQPCALNVSFKEHPATHITVEGTGALGIGWSREVAVLYLRGIAGVPQPNLSGFFVTVPAPFCSAPSEDTPLPISAFLTSVAPTGGTKIDFKSANPQGIKVVFNLTVPAGKTSAGFNALVKPGFTGFVNVTASATGAVLSKTIQVHPPSYCEEGSGNDPFNPVAYIPDWLAGCLRCTELIDLNYEGEGLIRVQGSDKFLQRGTLTDLTSLLNAHRLSATALTHNGLVTGLMTQREGEQPVAFKASLAAGPRAVEFLGRFTPVALTTQGVVVGHREGTAGPVAVMHNGVRLADLPLSARWSQVTGVSDSGHVIGLFEDGTSRVKGFRFFRGTARELPSEGQLSVLPVAVNALGQIAANVDDGRGGNTAAVIDARNALHRIETPRGFTGLRATSINSLGWMTLTASQERTTRGFLYTPKDGVVDLNQRIDPTLGMEVLDALRITDRNQILVRARVGEAVDLYLLSR